MQRLVQLGLSIAAIAALVVLVPFITGAHESRPILEEQDELTVGFLDEPAFVGEKNGLSLRVELINGEEFEPVVGLDRLIEAEVIFGDQSMALELSPAWQDPGH